MAEPIQIIITQGESGAKGVSDSLPMNGKSASTRGAGMFHEGEDLQFGFTKQESLAIAGLADNILKRSITYSINASANMTGNTISQTHATEAINLATRFAGEAIGIGAAFAMANPVIGATVAIGIAFNEGMNIATQLTQFNQMVSKTNYQASRMRERAGLSIANNSRGTEN